MRLLEKPCLKGLKLCICGRGGSIGWRFPSGALLPQLSRQRQFDKRLDWPRTALPLCRHPALPGGVLHALKGSGREFSCLAWSRSGIAPVAVSQATGILLGEIGHNGPTQPPNREYLPDLIESTEYCDLAGDIKMMQEKAGCHESTSRVPIHSHV